VAEIEILRPVHLTCSLTRSISQTDSVAHSQLFYLYYSILYNFPVSQHPKYFIISSIIAALALGTGFLQLNYESEYYYLYLNTRGQSLYEKATVETYFPSNYTGAFSPWRVSSIGRLARYCTLCAIFLRLESAECCTEIRFLCRIIMTARDGGSIFRTKIWKVLTK